MSKNQELLNSKLIQAIWDRNIQEVESVIAKGAEINVPDTYNITPLTEAINSQNFDLIKKLILTYKAEINLESHSNNSPLEAAVRTGNTDIISFLFANSEINQKSIINSLLNSYLNILPKKLILTVSW